MNNEIKEATTTTKWIKGNYTGYKRLFQYTIIIIGGS